MNTNTVSALVRRRRELTCRMNSLAEKHGKLAADLAALDAVLAMFRPDLDVSAIPALQVVNRPV